MLVRLISKANKKACGYGAPLRQKVLKKICNCFSNFCKRFLIFCNHFSNFWKHFLIVCNHFLNFCKSLLNFCVCTHFFIFYKHFLNFCVCTRFFCNHFLNFCESFLWRNSRSKYNLRYSSHGGKWNSWNNKIVVSYKH